MDGRPGSIDTSPPGREAAAVRHAGREDRTPALDRVTAMSVRTLLRPSVVAVTGLVAGFEVARVSGRREAGGAVFAAAGAWCTRRWWKTLGAGPAFGLLGLYTAAMGGSHPLAKKIGAWPSGAAVSGAVGAVSELASRRSRTGR